jgi:nitrate reductase gamma subunit
VPILFILVVLVVIALFVLWIRMLIECATKEPDTGNTKIVWILVILLAHFIGAAIYYFVRRPQRFAELRR